MEINLYISTIARKRIFSSHISERILAKENSETRNREEFNLMFISMIGRDIRNRITANTGMNVQEYEEQRVSNQNQM